MNMLWGGRFTETTDALMRAFNDSLPFDIRLWDADITGSKAYARALEKAGILSPAELETLLNGLQQVHAEFADGTFTTAAGDEDIHTAVERRLKELVGAVAGKLHTGRSRNDQVATDTRLWLRGEIASLRTRLQTLITAIADTAAAQIEVLMPGYTHLQQAQPVRFSHWLLGYGWKFARDLARLDAVARETNVLPLGSGALSGNPLPVDRQFLAETLGFAAVSANSMDAVADRDYLADFLHWATLTQTHLSSLAEDLIIFSSTEYGFIEISDAYSTGSSLMPQKKNPDSLELIRGKTGRIFGNYSGFLATLKGLPSTYDKDMQEDKEPLFDTVDTLAMTLPIAAGVIRTLKINRERMYNAMSSHLLATELADYLVEKGLPFREAHEVVGKVVQLSIETAQPLWSLPLLALKTISPLFDRDVHDWLDFENAVERRQSIGGTAKKAVLRQLDALRAQTG